MKEHVIQVYYSSNSLFSAEINTKASVPNNQSKRRFLERERVKMTSHYNVLITYITYNNCVVFLAIVRTHLGTDALLVFYRKYVLPFFLRFPNILWNNNKRLTTKCSILEKQLNTKNTELKKH
jgi:hypothetical protein